MSNICKALNKDLAVMQAAKTASGPPKRPEFFERLDVELATEPPKDNCDSEGFYQGLPPKFGRSIIGRRCDFIADALEGECHK